MNEKCITDPAQECRSATRLALLEKRVEDLEDGQGREEAFRRAYYSDKEERIARDARLEGKITEMDGKLDKVVAYQEAEQSKPFQLLDKLKENAVWMILAAVLGMALARLGLSA